MEAVHEVFNERVSEVKAYLNFLKVLDIDSVKVVAPQGKRRVSREVSSDELKLLKANAFLMIYNLVESSIREGFSFIYETVESQGTTYQAATQKLKWLWIKKGFKELDGNGDLGRNSQKAQEMIQDAIDGGVLSIQRKDLPISGNLDGRKIRELCLAHGVSDKVHYRAYGGVELRTVKDQRNGLAHGDMSFGECGRMYTVEDLERIARQVEIFIRSILRNIELFVNRRHFLIS